MSGSHVVGGNQLRAIVERIENIEEEIKELTEAKKEVYLEAKGNGFDVKILREVIRVRKQDQKERDEQETGRWLSSGKLASAVREFEEAALSEVPSRTDTTPRRWTSTWQRGQPRQPLRRFRSCSQPATTPSRTASSPASTGRGATLLGLM
jgi:uncharacterized protein (UPF0335 family)